MFKVNLEVPSSEVFLTLRKKAGMGPRSIEGAEKGLGRELFSVLFEYVSTCEEASIVEEGPSEVPVP